MTPVLRVARATNDIDRLLPFYEALGLGVLARFDGHAGFDGVILGGPGAPWHIEFTRAEGHAAPVRDCPDDLLVLYLPEEADWSSACARMAAAGFDPVAPFNPYWAERGRTYADPDGNRVVLQNADWSR